MSFFEDNKIAIIIVTVIIIITILSYLNHHTKNEPFASTYSREFMLTTYRLAQNINYASPNEQDYFELMLNYYGKFTTETRSIFQIDKNGFIMRANSAFKNSAAYLFLTGDESFSLTFQPVSSPSIFYIDEVEYDPVSLKPYNGKLVLQVNKHCKPLYIRIVTGNGVMALVDDIKKATFFMETF
jgi:hypothetical protein